MVIHKSGDITSSVKQSEKGYEMFAATNMGSIYHQSTEYKSFDSQSGSQCLLPSLLKDANLACSDNTTTIRHVDGSNTTCAYDLEQGTDCDGRFVVNCRSGIHSSKLSP
jgi:hypothetical protein